jgi:hypothetical protein
VSGKRQLMRLVVIVSCGLLVYCVMPKTPEPKGRFDVEPLGSGAWFPTTQLRQGTPIHALSLETMKEVTIAQGSGKNGFDSMRIMRDGSGYAVVETQHSRSMPPKFAKVPMKWSEGQVAGIVDAMNRDGLTKGKGGYSNGAFDGTQGFVEIVTSDGRIYVWLDNYFDVVKNTFRYCNTSLWPEVEKLGISGANSSAIEAQAEYYRVFPKTP